MALKAIVFILVLLPTWFHANGQTAPAGFYPKQILVDNSPVKSDTIRASIKTSGKTRVVIFDNGANKVSVLCYSKIKAGKSKHRERIEVYKNGRWKKSKLRFTHDGPRFRISRWPHRGFSSGIAHSSKTRHGFNINHQYEGENGQNISVTGYFEFITGR